MAGIGLIKRSETLTVEELKEKLPSKRQVINQETVDYLNEVMQNPDYDSSTFMDALIDYQSVMVDCKVSIPEYVNAIKFVGYLETGETLIGSYKKARAQDAFVQKRWNDAPDSDGYNALLAAASRYRRSKLVKQLMVQSLLPVNVMFQGERIKAVSVLATEMENAAYSKDRIAAAKELLTATKGPEQANVELQIGPSSQAVDLTTKLFDQLSKISEKQHERLVDGADIGDVQKIGITTEFVEADVDE